MIRNHSFWGLVLLFVLFSLSTVGCSSGCPEGFHEYAGQCIEDDAKNDGDGTPPDDGIIPPDDNEGPPSTPDDEKKVSGSGTCADPFVHTPATPSETMSGTGAIEEMSADIDSSPCRTTAATDGDVEEEAETGVDGDAEEEAETGADGDVEGESEAEAGGEAEKTRVTRADGDMGQESESEAGGEAEKEAETDGDEPTPSVLGLGSEVVVKLALVAGEQVRLSFSVSGGDALIYILLGNSAVCSTEAVCSAEPFQSVGPGETETTSFHAALSGNYYLVFDTVATSATGTYNYSITVSTEDTDGDEEDADAEEDVKPDGDMDGDTDGDLQEDQEVDTDGEDQAPITLLIQRPPLVPSDPLVPDNFTDLAWQDGGPLYLINDSGFMTWDWDAEGGEGGLGTFDGNPTPSLGPNVFRGVCFELPLVATWLNITTDSILPTTNGPIVLPETFGDEKVGLAYLAGKFYAADGSANKLFVFGWDGVDTAYTHEIIDLSRLTRLAGVTVAGNNLFVLDVTAEGSAILLIDKESGVTLREYRVNGKALSGIAYHTSMDQMWASAEAERRIYQFLTPQAPFSWTAE